MGSINFPIDPAARHFKTEDYRFEWEQAYVEGTKDFILRNTFGDMEAFAQTMQANNTRPEFEAYDVGHLYNLRFLQRSGLVKAPYWIQFVIGVLGAVAVSPAYTLWMKASGRTLLWCGYYRWCA